MNCCQFVDRMLTFRFAVERGGSPAMWRDSRGVERLLLAVAAGLITFSALQLGPLTASRPTPDRSPRQVNVDSQVDLTESTGLELPVVHAAAWVDPLNGTCRPVNSYVFVKTFVGPRSASP